MGYFDELKEKFIKECIFSYVESNNGRYIKEPKSYLNDFTYSEFNAYQATKIEDPVSSSLEQRHFILLDGNVKTLSEEILKGMEFGDSQTMMRLLSIYFFILVKEGLGLKANQINSPEDLNAEMSSLVRYEYDEVAMLLDIQNLSKLSTGKLQGTIKHHDSKGIFNKKTFDHLYPVVFVPRLGLDEILIFNKNYSFCYSDLNIYLDDNKVKVDVKIGIQHTEYIKLLKF